MFGELYVNFGIPGVIFGGAIFGWAFGRILRWIEQGLSNVAGQPEYSAPVVIWTGLVAYQVATSFVFTSGFFGVYVIGVLLGMGLIFKRLERAAAG